MRYAKINGNTVLQYPYTWDDLANENPFTKYDSRNSLPEWYALTEDAIQNGNSLVSYELTEIPVLDLSIHKSIDEELVLIDGIWTLTYTLVTLTDLEKDEFAKSKEALSASLNQ